MSNTEKRDHAFYLNLTYAIQLIQQDEGWYYVEIPDLPGCMSDGKTPEEAIRNIAQAKAEWLEDALESGYEIPLPAEMREYSGKFIVRVPKSLHARLAESAGREGTSLNQYLVSLLAERDILKRVERLLPKQPSRLNDQRTQYPKPVRTEQFRVADAPRKKQRPT
jgi:predicted RNase H-like HicB family nuclease